MLEPLVTEPPRVGRDGRVVVMEDRQLIAVSKPKKQSHSADCRVVILGAYAVAAWVNRRSDCGSVDLSPKHLHRFIAEHCGLDIRHVGASKAAVVVKDEHPGKRAVASLVQLLLCLFYLPSHANVRRDPLCDYAGFQLCPTLFVVLVLIELLDLRDHRESAKRYVVVRRLRGAAPNPSERNP